jgi:hypothetical protein
MNNLLYTDICCSEMMEKIKGELSLDVVLGLDPKTWTLSDSLNLIMLPSIKLAVINSINEITVIEMGLLHFMCKPIMVTSTHIKDYPTLEKRIIDYIEPKCDLRIDKPNFIEWYKNWER